MFIVSIKGTFGSFSIFPNEYAELYIYFLLLKGNLQSRVSEIQLIGKR